MGWVKTRISSHVAVQDAELRYRCPKKFHHRPFQDWRLGNLNSHGLLIFFVETATIWGMDGDGISFMPFWTIPTIGCFQAERWVEEFLEGSRMIWMERICSSRICHLQLVAFARCMTSRPDAGPCMCSSIHSTKQRFWMISGCTEAAAAWLYLEPFSKVPCMHCQYAEVYGMNILVACLEKLSVAVAFLHEIDIQELGYSWDWLDCWRLTFSAAILSQGLSDSHQTKDYSPCGASPRPG